jgi:hypothetical protein
MCILVGNVCLFAASSAEEVAFFTRLRQEVIKVSRFYESQEAACASLVEGLREMFRPFEVSSAPLPSAPRLTDLVAQGASVLNETQVAHALAQLLKGLSRLLELENFAVINYAGFGKILKKHDKHTGFTTKAQYMSKVVDRCSWAHYPRLLELLELVDSLYRDVLAKLGAVARERVLASSEQARVSSLSSLRRVTSSEKFAVSATSVDHPAPEHSRSRSSSSAAAAADSTAPVPARGRSASSAARVTRNGLAPLAESHEPGSDSDDDDSSARVPPSRELEVSPAERRQTELDIAAFIAGVSAQAPVSPIPSSSSSSSSTAATAAALSETGPAIASSDSLMAAATEAARSVGLDSTGAAIIAAAYNLMPGLPMPHAALLLRQHPYLSAAGPLALAQTTLMHLQRGHWASTGAPPPYSSSMAVPVTGPPGPHSMVTH